MILFQDNQTCHYQQKQAEIIKTWVLEEENTVTQLGDLTHEKLR